METPKIAPSESGTHKPAIQFLTTGTPPPSPFYISQEENLRIDIWNSFPGIIINVAGRLLTTDGDVKPFSKNFAPTSDRLANNFIIPTGESFLLSLVIGPTSGVVSHGQIFLQAGIQRGSLASGLITAALISAYIPGGGSLAWPGGVFEPASASPGNPRSITGTDPAAGVEISETVPTNARWRLIAFTATLVTSAAVANRRLRLAHDDGANIYCNAFSTLLLPASTTTPVTWGDSYPLVENTDQQITAPLPRQDILRAGFRIRTITTNFQAGDNWGAPQYLVEEWIDA